MNNIRSMTGYGKGEYSDGNRCFITEIKTVNNRYSDVIIKTPKHLRFFEESIRKIVKKNISRGRVEVYITTEYYNDLEMEIIPNIELAKSYNKAISEIREVLNIDKEPVIDTILKLQDVLTMRKKEEDEDQLSLSLENSINNAIEKLIAMRSREGNELKKDIAEKVLDIDKLIDEIEKHSQNLVEEYKERLELRVKDFFSDKCDLDENRLYNEIVFYADKSDINEEIVRLRSHVEQINQTLENGGVIGRKLDFIIQEANREINTIGSKVGNLSITKFVVEIKNLLEKIREQIQNIE